jgi:proteasome lid subunit RPN8/RPN11
VGPVPPAVTVTIDPGVLARLRAAHGAAGAHEVVGALGGWRTRAGWRVAAFVALPNVAADPAAAFAVAPDTFVAAHAALARAGTPWIGFVHGHPRGAAAPSAADHAALWRDGLQLIVAGPPERTELRAWHWDAAWREALLHVRPATAEVT